jgi:hypothetical protein
MATRDAKEKELWAAFAVAAMQSYSPDVADADDMDEVVDGMVEVASTFADAMLDAMDARYTEKARRGSKRRRASDADDDDEDDE